MPSWLRTGHLKFGMMTNRLIVTLGQWPDIKEAAARCMITVEEAENMLAQEGVQEEIEKYHQAVGFERAIIDATAAVATETYFKARLVETIETPDIDPDTKVKAIMVGLKSTGALQSENRPGAGGTFVFQLQHIEPKQDPALPPARPILQASKVTPASDDGPIIEFIKPKTGTSA